MLKFIFYQKFRILSSSCLTGIFRLFKLALMNFKYNMTYPVMSSPFSKSNVK